MTRIAFLGLGRMGAPMATNLLRAGFALTVWNRTPARTDPLVAAGAKPAASPREAVADADIVITMLTDGPATWAVATGPDGFLAARPNVVWVQMGTLGLDWTDRLGTLAAQYGAGFVDAPVSGSEGPAKAGKLTVLASGPDTTRERLTPVFEAVGTRTVWLGEAGAGTRAKLVLNTWLADQVEATAEILAFSRALQLDPELMMLLLESSPLASPYAVAKARTMLAGDFTPAFALQHALKDAKLAISAAHAKGAELTLTEALLPRWQRAADAHGEQDVAVVFATPAAPNATNHLTHPEDPHATGDTGRFYWLRA
jgi:3-hydroxyisobutyrate dehydrogenase